MFSILYSLTSGSILLLAFLIFTNPRKVNESGNRWLAFFLFTLFFLFIDSALLKNKVYNEYPHLFGLDGFFVFSTAPALYFCVSQYISPQKKFKKTDLLHFLPTFLLFPFLLLGIFMSAEEKLKQINQANKQPVEPDFFFYLIGLQMAVYLGFSFVKLLKHRKNIEIFASNTAKIDLNWLKFFLMGIATMLLLWFFDSFSNEGIFTSLFSVVGYFISVFPLGYFALRQEEIFPFKEAVNVEINEIIEETAQLTTKQQRVPEAEIHQMKDKLTVLMASEKLFLDETLSLPKLAEKMDISVHSLSYLLNIGFDSNFFQFVNRYRVEEAKELLISPKHAHLSMVGIAFACGFGSKTTFNTTFKKITGFSPSQFITDSSKENFPS